MIDLVVRFSGSPTSRWRSTASWPAWSGITAGADTVITRAQVHHRGLVAGVLVVFSVMFFDRIKIDDPVGAISVHLVCGIWGTLAVGIFSTNPEHSLRRSGPGRRRPTAASPSSPRFALFGVLKATMGIRVSEEEELEGLDLGEHGQHAYDLAAGPGWLEQQTGVTARVAPGARAPPPSPPAKTSEAGERRQSS